MKKMLFTSVAAIALGLAPASAADLAARYTKAPAQVVNPGTNWSGFYVGVMGGYGWSDQVRIDVPALGAGATVNSGDLRGGFGGGTIGYNWQGAGSNLVWGLEVDAAGASLRAETPGIETERINAFGSVTGRLGYAVGPALLYAKGGYAWANAKIDVLGASQSNYHSGWTVGGGAEWMFAPAWSAKVEYMYADYSKENYFANVVVGGVNVGASVHTIKAGVNYHFR